MRQPLVAGNWKMNGSRASVKELLEGIKNGMGSVAKAEVAVCAPYIYIPDTQAATRGHGDRLGRAESFHRGVGRLYGRDCGLHAAGFRLQICHRRAFRAAQPVC